MRLLPWLLIPILAVAQTTVEKKKHTPETPRELAAELLQSAYDGVGTAQPKVQPFLLWRIGDCYTVLDKKKAREILDQAFSDATVLGQGSPDLESNIAIAMSEIDLSRSVEMLRAVPPPDGVTFSMGSRDTAISKIIRRLLAENKIDEAIEALNLLSGGPEYPYSSADAILGSLDKEQRT